MTEEKNIHAGHRKRLRERYERTGIQGFEGYSALELLLSFALPRKDTNPLAHELIARFGNLYNVLHAPKEELMKVSGVGEYAATLLRLVPDIVQLSKEEKQNQTDMVLNTSEKAGRYFQEKLADRQKETLLVVCIDQKKRVCCCEEIGRGEKNIAVTNLQEIAQLCLQKNSTDILMAHNHPSGIAYPSQQDLVMTRRVNEFLSGIGIHLHDHFVVADQGYYSMKEHKIL